MNNTILTLDHLSISFDTTKGEVQAVRDVCLSVQPGEILAVVGESGCGKTVMCQSVMKLLPRSARVKTGRIVLDGTDITDYKEKQMQKIRGSQVSMVFQDPMATLNPTLPIGRQVTEALLKHKKMTKKEARDRAIEMLQMVGIEDPAQRFYLQPHFFSGGMRQRSVLAIALALEPKLLFADEPTTALDVTVQRKILDLLLKIREKTGIAVIFVSHDLGVVAQIADRVAIMYAGKIVEIGTAKEIFYDPRHPYTWGLMEALPTSVKKGERLRSIPGMPPSLLAPPPGDAFAPRNRFALAIDYEKMPPLFEITPTHLAATWLLDARAPKIQQPVTLKRRDPH